MAIKMVLAGASLALFAFAAAPAAYAANDGDFAAPPAASSPASGVPSSTQAPAARPHRVMDPAKRAALRAKRKARREARRQARQQQMQSTAPN
jgi:hypothetical protein